MLITIHNIIIACKGIRKETGIRKKTDTVSGEEEERADLHNDEKRLRTTFRMAET